MWSLPGRRYSVNSGFLSAPDIEEAHVVFKKQHIRSQYKPKPANPNSVRFGLFCWAETIELLAFHEVTVVIPDEQDTGSVGRDVAVGRAPWGVHITINDGGDEFDATMSCMIQVAGVRWGLTAAHAFCHPWTTSPEAYNTDSDDSDTHNMESDDSDADDEEYDTVTEQDDHGKARMDLHPASPLSRRGKDVRLGKSHVWIPTHEDTSSAWMREHSNLDWALLDLGLEETQMSTSATAAEELPIANHLPQQCLDVLIITRAHLDVPATLYNIPSYIGGVKGSQAAEVWTVGCVPENIRKFRNDR